MKLKSLKSSLSAAIALAGMVFAGASAADTIMSVTEMSYDAVGRLDCTALRMNPATYSGTLPSACTLATAGTEGPDRITKNVYDAAGQVTQVLQAVGTTDQRTYSTFSYSPNGRVVDSIDSNGNRTRLTYDGFDRLSGLHYPSKTAPTAFNPTTQTAALASAGAHSTTDYEAHLYDANGNRTWHRRRDGRALDFQYDNLNRQIVRSASDASLRSIHTTYDATGKILKKTFDGFNGPGVSYAYDGLGRVKSTTDMNNRMVAYLYNAAGARERLTDPDGTWLSYASDYANRLTSITHSSGVVMFSQGYNSLGQRRKLQRGALISGSEAVESCVAAVNATCYSYDGIGRLTGLSHDLASTGNDVAWGFSYNRASQIVNLSSSNALYDYVETQTSTKNHTYNGLNQDTGIAAVDSNTGFDTNGNLTKDGNRVMVYDLENRLLSVAHAGTPTTPFLTLTYDPEGRLSKYTLNGVATDYLYDGVNLIGEYIGGTRQRAYVHGTGVDEPIVWAQGSGWGSRQYFVQNYQGSVIRIADINGNATDLYKYGPYGEPRDASNNASWSGSRFRYTGQTTLPDAQLYYYKARVYDPNMGRFFQTDPIGSKDDLNLYAYVAGDPINYRDPTGLANCPTNDKNCIETPASASDPSLPKPSSPEVEQITEVVVTGHRKKKTSDNKPIRYNIEDETLMGATPSSLSRRDSRQRDITCPSGDTMTIATMAPLAEGSSAVHTHTNSHDGVPSGGDHLAARQSSTGAAYMMTESRVFLIETGNNGTFRTSVVSGPSLNAAERSKLVSNMQNWENPKSTNSSNTITQRVCQ